MEAYLRSSFIVKSYVNLLSLMVFEVILIMLALMFPVLHFYHFFFKPIITLSEIIINILNIDLSL